jgi:hypothetical protein
MIVDDDLILKLSKKIDINKDTPEVVSWLSVASMLIEQRHKNTDIFKKIKFEGRTMSTFERELYKDNLKVLREMYETITKGILENE